MIYGILRWITGIAIHWFYRDIRIVGKEKIPPAGPLLIAVNHQNALVDSLIVGWVFPRKISMTAKATLADNPAIAAIFTLLHIVPLRRVSDEARKPGGSPLDRSRNEGAFREILALLAHGGAVLFFPEGKSHNESGLEPLKSGLARVAVQARDVEGIRNLRILPVGLVFENKALPGTVVGARVGNPIDMEQWAGSDAAALTEEIASRLRGVSESAGLPAESRQIFLGPTKGSIGDYLIASAAWWGRWTHKFPVRIARDLAVSHSTDADQPAMFTILFGLGLVLLTYAIQAIILSVLIHSVVLVCAYVASLVLGAYWAAFEHHPRRY